MNTIDKIRIKKLIKRLSEDKNFSLPLKEHSYFSSLLLKDGIELSLILTLLKMSEITIPGYFNFTLADEFIEREHLNLPIKDKKNNFFYVAKQCEIAYSTEEEVKTIKRVKKADEDLDEDDGGESKTQNNGSRVDEFQDEIDGIENEQLPPHLRRGNRTHSTFVSNANELESDDLSQDDIFDNIKTGKNDPITNRVKMEKEKDEESVDYDKESENG